MVFSVLLCRMNLDNELITFFKEEGNLIESTPISKKDLKKQELFDKRIKHLKKMNSIKNTRLNLDRINDFLK